jgi:hypothetical protein
MSAGAPESPPVAELEAVDEPADPTDAEEDEDDEEDALPLPDDAAPPLPPAPAKCGSVSASEPCESASDANAERPKSAVVA